MSATDSPTWLSIRSASCEARTIVSSAGAAGAPSYADHNPHLIVHYIDAHAYMPPQAFIAAVREGTPTVRLD
jgi:hypothetical protein